MILSGREISSQVANGSITIEPFEKSLLNPNSYNYRLGESLMVSETYIQDPRLPSTWRKILIGAEGVIIEPGRFYLGATFEEIGSKNFVISLIGRSSIGRLGLYLQISADLSQIGLVHRWTLELTSVQPVRVYPRMKIGQVSFWRPSGDRADYNGRYSGTQQPTSSRFWIDWEDGPSTSSSR